MCALEVRMDRVSELLDARSTHAQHTLCTAQTVTRWHDLGMVIGVRMHVHKYVLWPQLPGRTVELFHLHTRQLHTRAMPLAPGHCQTSQNPCTPATAACLMACFFRW